MKKTLAILLTLVMILCAYPTTLAETGALKFGICVATMTNEYFVEFAEGAKAWCEQNGIEALVKDAADDISKQVTAVEDFINAGCDAIIINALDDEALRAVVAQATGAGIPVISESVDVEGCTACAIVDEHDYGYGLGVEAGKWAEAHFPGQEVQFAVLTQSTLPTTIARSDGIVDGVMEYCKTAKCVTQEDAYTTDKGVTVAENILNAYPEIKMILGMNDAGALGAFEAAKAFGIDAANRDGFFIGGTDGDAQAMAKVKAGTIYQCTIALTESNPVVGANCVKAAYEALQNGGVVDDYLIAYGPVMYDE